MRKYRLLILGAVLILMPGLAKAGGIVRTPEPGIVSLLGVGLLGLACFSGVLTVKNIIAGRRLRSTSIEKL